MTSALRHLPNLVTVARGAAGMVGAVLLVESARSVVETEAVRLALSAALIFGLAALSDGLDGWLARRLNAESALGALLDPIADKVLIGAYLIAYVVLSGYDAWLAAPVTIILVRDVLVTGARLTWPSSGTLTVSEAAKYKTAAQMIVTALPFGLVIAGFRDPAVWYFYWVGGVWFLALMTAWTGWPYLQAAFRDRD